jgi:hypothetical protein
MFDRLRDIPLDEAHHSLPTPAAGEPVTRAAEPILVYAWVVDRRGQDQRIPAAVTAWTPRAVRIRYQDSHRRTGYAWVWANAVERVR